MHKTQLEAAFNAADTKKIVHLLETLVESTRPNTTAEIVEEFKSTSTADEWQRLLTARLSKSTLGEVVHAIADVRGVPMTELCNPYGKALEKSSRDEVRDEK